MKHKEENILKLTEGQFEKLLELPIVRDTYQYFCTFRVKPGDYEIEGLEGRRWFKYSGIVFVEAVDDKEE